MTSIGTLHVKRQTLIAQREQLAANLNATCGAIAMCDELIGEAMKEAEEAAKAASEAITEKVAADIISDAPNAAA